mgnify:CR=1 FL=1
MTTILTSVERAERALHEDDFQVLVTDLAERLGWSWLHIRPGRTEHGWRTPISGPLGKGFPDLVLLRVRDRRLLFVELKRELEQPDAAQAAVLAALGTLAGAWVDQVPGGPGLWIHVRVWRPSDLRDPIVTSRIYEVLR